MDAMMVRRALGVAVGGLIWLVFTSGASAAGTWSAPEQLDTSVARSADAVLISCPTAGLCVGSSYFTNGPVVFTGKGAAIESDLTIPVGSNDDEVALSALQCPSAHLCVGVADYLSGGDSGSSDSDLVVSTAPAEGQDAWGDQHVSRARRIPRQLSCPTASFCAGANALGVLSSRNPAGGASTWTQATVGARGLVDVDCPSADFCAGFDPQGAIWTSTDPSGSSPDWQQSGAIPLAAAGRAVTDGDDNSGAGTATVIPEVLSCAGPNFCLASDGKSGSALISTDPASSAAWTPVSVDTGPISAVYCEPGKTLCLAGDEDGDIAASDNGGASWSTLSLGQDEAISELSCVGANCAATDGEPVLATVPTGGVPTAWTPINVPLHDALTSISCPSADECIGSDPLVNYQAPSRYFFSSGPVNDLDSWSHIAVQGVPGRDGGGTLNSSCFSATGCLAVFSSRPNAGRPGGLYSFNPVGGPHAFRDLNVGGNYGALYTTCSQGTCVSGYPGRWFISADPGDPDAWHAITDPRFDVTCLSGNHSCVALADGPFHGTAGHDLLVAPKRTGPWTAQRIDPTGYIDGLACTSRKVCVVVDEGGRMLISTHPTAGASSWTLSTDDPDGFDEVACETANRCIAADSRGAIVTGHP